MSDRLTDERLAWVRETVRDDPDAWDCVPSEDLYAILARLERAERELDKYRSKAIAYDLDRAGIESREREAVELVDARARIAEFEVFHRAVMEALDRIPGDDSPMLKLDDMTKRIAELEAENAALRSRIKEIDGDGFALDAETKRRMDDLSGEILRLREHIAELEATIKDRDALIEYWKHRGSDKREAQLAEMRQEIENVGQYELCATGRMFVPRRNVLEIIDRYGIPTGSSGPDEAP